MVVEDTNDNRPVFSQDQYRTTLTENAVVGTTVAVISATDGDSGTNGQIMYSFSGTITSKKQVKCYILAYCIAYTDVLSVEYMLLHVRLCHSLALEDGPGYEASYVSLTASETELLYLQQ